MRQKVLLVLVVLSAIGMAFMPSCRPFSSLTPSDEMSLEEKKDRAMPRKEKAATMAEDFPLEVPLHDGQVTSTRGSNAESVWSYEVDVAERPETVAEWYLWALPAAGWRSEGDVGDATRGTRVLSFTKGSARCDVAIESGANHSSLVRGVVGLGVPIDGML